MPTAASMLEAFANNFPGLIQALTMAAYVLGMWCGISGFILMCARQQGSRPHRGRYFRHEPDRHPANPRSNLRVGKGLELRGGRERVRQLIITVFYNI